MVSILRELRALLETLNKMEPSGIATLSLLVMMGGVIAFCIVLFK